MISWPTDLDAIHALNAQFSQIERVDGRINHTMLSSTQSSRHSGNSVNCRRSVPATNPAI